MARQPRALQAERARETTERMLLAHRDTIVARLASLDGWLAQFGDASGTTAAHGRWLFWPDGDDTFEHVSNGDDALARVEAATFDLVLLDVMMPGRDGLKVCEEARRRGHQVPILFVTARSLDAERILRFHLGADDYIVKPFSSLELRARVDAACVARRAREVLPCIASPTACSTSSGGSCGEATRWSRARPRS